MKVAHWQALAFRVEALNVRSRVPLKAIPVEWVPVDLI